MKPSKCHFFAKEVQYLGHVLSTIGIKPPPSKTVATKLMKPLKNAKQVRALSSRPRLVMTQEVHQQLVAQIAQAFIQSLISMDFKVFLDIRVNNPSIE